MKVSVKKIRGAAGDMQLVLLRDTEFVMKQDNGYWQQITLPRSSPS